MRAITTLVTEIIANHKKKARLKELHRQETLKKSAREVALHGPDTKDALKGFKLVFGTPAWEDISEIYYQKHKEWGVYHKISFRVSKAGWERALALHGFEGFEIGGYRSSGIPKPPDWPNDWPVKPSTASLYNGCPSKPLCNDSWYSYCDKRARRLFLSSGQTATERKDYYQALLERSEKGG